MKPLSTETDWSAPRTAEGEGSGGHAPAPRRGSKFWAYAVPAVLLALFAWLAFSRIQSKLHVRAALVTAVAESGETSVSVIHPTRSSANQSVTLPGNVQAYVETPIYARTDGYLTHWYVDIGGRVKEGQLLATIDTPEVDQQLVQAQAAELQAQANLDLAKTTADRWQNLLKSDGVSQQEVDQNESAYKARQADENAALANVARLKYMQSFQKVVAPFAGIITARDIDIGALISNGNAKPLFQLAQIDVLRVYVDVPEAYSNDIHLGMPAEMRVAQSPNVSYTGKVAHTAGAIDTTSRTLLTEVQVPNPTGKLMPGSYAEVTFRLGAATTPPLIIPSNALVFRSSGPQVVVVDSNKTARLRTITIGRDLGNRLEVLSGLQPSDSVVVNPPDSISDGTPVTVQETQPDETPAPNTPSPSTQQPPAAVGH